VKNCSLYNLLSDLRTSAASNARSALTFGRMGSLLRSSSRGWLRASCCPVGLALLCVWWILVSASGDMSAQVAAGLAEAAQSPEGIQRFVETHSTFDWGPLWRALKLPGQTTPLPCAEEFAWQICSSELITIFNPAQTIVLLQRGDSNSETYLRYMRQPNASGSIQWRFAGIFQSSAKYFPLHHRILVFANSPFLAVTGQAVNGTGVSSEIESWMDLRDTDFKPVFAYTIEGEYSALFDGYVSRKFHGSVIALKKAPAESITVSYRVDFTDDQNPDRIFHLGTREDKVVFTRRGDSFALDETASTIGEAEFDKLYSKFGDAFSCDELVHYDFAALSGIAMAPSALGDQLKGWLGRYLDDWCSNTPERASLEALIQRTPVRIPRERLR
jgi:hypothetical protein